MKKSSLPIKIFLLLLGIMAVLLCLHLAMQYLNISYNEKHGQVFEISNRLDVDDEASIPTWFAQAVWIGIAGASFLAAKLSRDRRVRQLWYVNTLVGVLFSIDEVAGIHELSLQSLHLLFFGLQQPTSTLNAWWLVIPLIVAFGFVFLKRLYEVLHTRQWLLIMFGWALFMAGAVGFELFGNDVKGITFFYQGIITGAEEGLEMLGSIIILYVVTNYLHINHAPQLKQAWQFIHNPKDSY